MNRSHAVAVAVTLALSSAAALAKPPPKAVPLVNLEIESPRYNPSKDPRLPLESAAGWPLVFKLTANQSLGIAQNYEPPDFPLERTTGYVVFSDPDGCLSLPPPFDNFDICQGVTDETYLEFTNDVDIAGVQDAILVGNLIGNPGRRLALADDTQSGSPFFNNYVEAPRQIGPNTGGGTDDGFGFGADDDLPGLVLLSANGNGLVLDADFNRPSNKALRNLAGFLNWVSYELRSSTGQTVVHAGMNVTQNLIAPLVAADDCVGTFTDPNSIYCELPPRYRIDGSPVVLHSPANTTLFQDLYASIASAITYRVRAFVVSGVAPSVLGDEDGDGDVDAADATAAGYTVISNEATLSLRRYVGSVCGSEANYFQADIDGNGRHSTAVICPPGPGSIKSPPD